MTTQRWSVIGLARARVGWFGEVGRWAASSQLPADFARCVSAAEVRLRLESAAAVSAVLLDAGASGVDRDLVAAARDAGAAVLVVDDERTSRDWSALGASAVLPPSFDVDLLLSHLRALATPAVRPARHLRGNDEPSVFLAPVVTVLGVPGAGASNVAMAAAQGLADRPDGQGSVLLADLALDGMLGAYHDSPDVVPGVQEVVEAHRGGAPDRAAVRAATYEVVPRGYSLLAGLRRPRDWVALPTQATEAALRSLRSAFRWVVADVTAELDGEAETGSIDVEERNQLARLAVREASCVLVVGEPGLRGVRGLVRLLDDLAAHAVEGRRVLPVVNRAPRSPARRAAITRTVAELTVAELPASPLFLPERRGLEAVHATVERLPSALVAPVAGAVSAVVDVEGAPTTDDGPGPVRVARLAS
jgi:hypothetical protein